jgi:hypothetical protein
VTQEFSGPILGVDPGRSSGAAVLLASDGKRVENWWTWKLMKRKSGEVWRVMALGLKPEAAFEADAMWQVGQFISNCVYRAVGPEPALILEGLFVPWQKKGRKRQSPQSVIPLAEATGELVGGLRMTPRLRPLANLWRAEVLSLPARTPAAEAEQAAQAYARVAFDWPDGEGPPTEAERGALAEAACIAFWGRGQLRWQRAG